SASPIASNASPIATKAGGSSRQSPLPKSVPAASTTRPSEFRARSRTKLDMAVRPSTPSRTRATPFTTSPPTVPGRKLLTKLPSSVRANMRRRPSRRSCAASRSCSRTAAHKCADANTTSATPKFSGPTLASACSVSAPTLVASHANRATDTPARSKTPHGTRRRGSGRTLVTMDLPCALAERQDERRLPVKVAAEPHRGAHAVRAMQVLQDPLEAPQRCPLCERHLPHPLLPDVLPPVDNLDRIVVPRQDTPEPTKID